MENYNKKIRIKIVLFLYTLLISCDQVSPYIAPKLPDSIITGDWRYETLLINEDTFNILDWNFEPIKPLYVIINDVKFRWFKYLSDGTYEFRWDSSDPDTGIGENLNYQPAFGFWKLSPNGDTLIHNEGFQYETHYKIIELTEERFIREYPRIIQIIDDFHAEKWGVEVGDTVVYREIFVPKID